MAHHLRKWLRGRASPCQGEGRGFESRLPLHSQQDIRPAGRKLAECCIPGEVVEWFKAAVLKTAVVARATVGSNPTLSAIESVPQKCGFFAFQGTFLELVH